MHELYSDMLDCICLAGSFLPMRNISRNNNRVVGWNNYCKSLYADARKKFLAWHKGGRLRYGPCFENMKSSRTVFKNALNYCKKNEAKIRKEILLENFLDNKYKFWKELSKINGNSSKKAVLIDGKTDLNEIAMIFDEKYRKILDDPSCQNGQFSQAAMAAGWDEVFINDG